jgi:hypothetical protein
VSVRSIDDGYDFRVVVLDDTWVVRVPRWEFAREALVMEAALLPALAPAGWRRSSASTTASSSASRRAWSVVSLGFAPDLS